MGESGGVSAWLSELPEGSCGRVVWDALPGTTAEIVEATGVYVKRVREFLRAWRSEGLVGRHTRWWSEHGYTWVYYRTEDR